MSPSQFKLESAFHLVTWLLYVDPIVVKREISFLILYIDIYQIRV